MSAACKNPGKFAKIPWQGKHRFIVDTIGEKYAPFVSVDINPLAVGFFSDGEVITEHNSWSQDALLINQTNMYELASPVSFKEGIMCPKSWKELQKFEKTVSMEPNFEWRLPVRILRVFVESVAVKMPTAARTLAIFPS